MLRPEGWDFSVPGLVTGSMGSRGESPETRTFSSAIVKLVCRKVERKRVAVTGVRLG